MGIRARSVHSWAQLEFGAVGGEKVEHLAAVGVIAFGSRL
jgi:hypothetical protein